MSERESQQEISSQMEYNREQNLKNRLNSFLESELGFPSADYYSRLSERGFLTLKSVLGDINNIFTLKVTLAFANWLGRTLGFSESDHAAMMASVVETKPNANGFDIEILMPRMVIAEVKCNQPINGGKKFGSAQKEGIEKDLTNLIGGKSKSPIDPDQCLKFMVLLDSPEVRIATKHLLESTKIDTKRIVELELEGDLTRLDSNRVYIKYIGFSA